MNVAVLSRQQAVERVGYSLGLDGSELNGELSPALVGQALRRATSILAPCARYELERSVRQTLQPLGSPGDVVGPMVQDVLESLIVYRDLLEMRSTADEVWASADVTIRPAAPSFVKREDGSIAVLGTAGDVITPIPDDLPARLVHRGALRLLIPTSAEPLAPRLQEFGLVELSEKAWLRLPRVEQAGNYVEEWHQRLREAPIGSRPEGLLICKPTRRGMVYRDRWSPAEVGEKGLFVARRPQRFGANLWCLVDLQPNSAARILDLFSTGDTLRSCDVAWQIQMALDARAGLAQAFRCRPNGDRSTIDFFSPIPSWAERRLFLVGRRQAGTGCLYSYEMATNATEGERRFLRESLWLVEQN